MQLTKLFFENDRVDESDIKTTAELLNRSGWTRDQTKKTLVQLITPHAKRNIGFGLPTAIGEFDIIEPENIAHLILRSEAFREKYKSPYLFAIQDWLNYRILKKRKIEQLLNLITSEF